LDQGCREAAMIRTRKRLSFWQALPPYLGGKRRLCGIIFREIDRLIPRRLWPGLTFVDAFLGGGSVALYAKAQGFRVVATDIARRSVVVGEALVANHRVRLAYADVLRILAPREGEPGPVERRHAPSVFPSTVARAIDACLNDAERSPIKAKAALLRLLALRMAMRCHPMSQVRAGTIERATAGAWESITPSCRYHYVEALHLATPKRLWRLAQEINAGVFAGQGEVQQGSALELLPGIQADITYFDPPYPNTASFEREYRVLDEIFEGQALAPSPFTSKDGTDQIDALLDVAAHIPLWVLSFGNAACSLDALETKMVDRGRQVRVLEIKYAHKVSVARKDTRAANREFLVLGWDPESLPTSGPSFQSSNEQSLEVRSEDHETKGQKE
jgi:adenine-specific DNA methylase